MYAWSFLGALWPFCDLPLCSGLHHLQCDVCLVKWHLGHERLRPWVGPITGEAAPAYGLTHFTRRMIEILRPAGSKPSARCSNGCGWNEPKSWITGRLKPETEGEKAVSQDQGGHGAGCKSGCDNRLLSPFPLSPAAEERGMKSSGGVPRVALADSLTRGYFLKPLRGFSNGVGNTPTALSPPAPRKS